MQRIFFCTGASFITGDDVAMAVLEYAWTLAQYRRYDLIRIPTQTEAGETSVSTLLIGPASQISSQDVLTSGAELIDEAFVASLHARSAQLREPLPIAQLEDGQFAGEMSGANEA